MVSSSGKYVSIQLMSMMAMRGLRLSRPRALLNIVHNACRRETFARRGSCNRWRPQAHRGGDFGVGDLAADPFAEGRESAGGAAAADGGWGGGAASGRGGALRASDAASRAGGGGGAGGASSDGVRPARCGVLTEAPTVAEGILILLLLQAVGGNRGGAAWDAAAAGPRAAGGGDAAGVSAHNRRLSARGAAGTADADGACSSWLRTVAARDALPAAESLAVRADDDDVGSGRLAPSRELPPPGVPAL